MILINVNFVTCVNLVGKKKEKSPKGLFFYAENYFALVFRIISKLFIALLYPPTCAGAT
jgi:hypothetical protein